MKQCLLLIQLRRFGEALTWAYTVRAHAGATPPHEASACQRCLTRCPAHGTRARSW